MDGRTLLAVGLVVLGALFFLTSFAGELPPSDVRGHVEAYPPQKMMYEPIPIEVHKHILEHTPEGLPGIVINYNCEDFDCPEGMLDSIEQLTDAYVNVYAAPYPGMSSMVAISRYGAQRTFSNYDEQGIREFIRGGG